MKYRKQKHKYVYNGLKQDGHIMWTGSETTMCGIVRFERSLSKMYVNWLPEVPLCLECQKVLKAWLAKEYGVDGWA